MNNMQSVMAEDNESMKIKELKRKLNFDKCDSLFSEKVSKYDFDINKYEPCMAKKLDSHDKRTSVIKIFKHTFERKYIRNDLVISFEDVFINIGTYGYTNESKSVFLSEDGLTFFVPTFRNRKELKILNIDLTKIIRILIYSSETNPMIFFSVSNDIAGYIRNLLSMVDAYEPYFNPESNDLKHQYIVISPARMNDESKDQIKYLFINKNLTEIGELEIDNYLAPLSAAKEFNDKHDEISLYALSHSEVRTLYAQVIKVGTRESFKKRVFSISTNEFIFSVPPVQSGNIFYPTITIKMDQIDKILIRFSDTLPILFFYITKGTAKLVKKILDMKDLTLSSKGTSCNNKIIVFPREIPQDCDVIKTLMNKGKIHKLKDEDAYNILAISVMSSALIETIHFRSIELEINNLSLGPAQFKQQIKLEMSYLYFKLYIPLNGGIHIGIDFADVTKFLYYISKFQLNVLQLFITPIAENKIRSLLKVINFDKGQYSSELSNTRLNKITIGLCQPGKKKFGKLNKFLNNLPFTEKLNLIDAKVMHMQLHNSL